MKITQENLRLSFWIILSLSLVIASYSAFSYVRTYSDSMMMRSFSVTGEAKLSAVPDIAEFSFGVVTEGGLDMAKLQTDNSAKMNKIITYLKDKKIPTKDIRTTSYNLEPRYQYNACQIGICPPPAIVGYSIRQSALVRVRDFSLIGDLLAGVVANGGNNVSQLNFTFDDKDALLGQVRGEAVKRAQLKAEAMAKTAGFRLGKLLNIEDNYPYASPQMGMGGGPELMMAKSADSRVPVEAGSQDLSASVILRYAIK